MHSECSHNLERGIVGRVLGEVPRPNTESSKRLKSMARIVGAKARKWVGPVEAWGYHTVCECFSGVKRQKYERAAQSLEAHSCRERDAWVEQFVKGDKTLFTEARGFKDPRVISYRDPRYALDLACYTKPIELRFYKLNGFAFQKVAKSRLFAKGLTSSERAQLLQKKLAEFHDPVVISMDCERFDKHVNSMQISTFHMVMRMLCGDSHFDWLLKQQVNNIGRYMGRPYRIGARLMSGDPTTSLLANVIVLTSVLCALRGMKFDFLGDGDDSLVIVERQWKSEAKEKLAQFMLGIGHEVTFAEDGYCLEQVEFCQSKPCKTEEGYVMVRNPLKVLSCALSGLELHGLPPHRRLERLRSVGLAELYLNRGVPVLQEFALAIIKATQGAKEGSLTEGLGFRQGEWEARGIDWKGAKPLVVSAEARESFALAWGLSVEWQLEAEEAVRKLCRADLMAPDQGVVDGWYAQGKRLRAVWGGVASSQLQ